MSLSYRRAEERDLPFVVRSWVSSYRTAYAAGLLLMDDYRLIMERQVRRVLERPGVEVWVAYAPDEDDPRADLYGWIAVERGYEVPVAGRMQPAEEPLVHYCYVKSNYRREGIARGLFRAAGIDPAEPFAFTCTTGVVADLRHKIPRARWNPLIARHPKQS